MRALVPLALLLSLGCRTKDVDNPLDLDGDGFVAAEDCDDEDPDVNPAAAEVPYDGVDNDCAPATPDDDLDGDGVGQADGDCDDTDPTVGPGADEVCNGVDDDCDGDVDEDLSGTWYADADADGWGDASQPTETCDGAGLATTSGDCDDADAAVHPGATERCDGADQDCDGEVDEDATDASTWYLDGDGDGYGLTDVATEACEQPEGWAAVGGDCDDLHDAALPGGTEVCDGLDNDCDGAVDGATATDASTWFPDGDGDGFAGGEATVACEAPGTSWRDAATDCDDTDPGVFPGAPELCNGVDDDCDGGVDVDALDAPEWYADVDGDTWGAGLAVRACTAPTGHVARDGDCDDGDPTEHPEAPEVCDGEDDDCDGGIDEAATDATTWYLDADRDGSGDAARTLDACDAPSGYVGTAGDCDDLDATSHPGGAEVCDGADNDCDGTVDVGATDALAWYADGDGDEYGAGSAVLACEAPAGHVVVDGDCDDTAADVHPGAEERCDPVDHDCDGDLEAGAVDATEWYADGDDDGYGAGAVVVACAAPADHVADGGDCDDTVGAVHPGADEVCNAVDDDCDGEVDEDAVDGLPWYGDVDEDGWGAGAPLWACEAPAGSAGIGGDCDDDHSTVHPGAAEVCNGVDDDCDGVTDTDATDRIWWYLDGDDDTYGSGAGVLACDAPVDHVAAAGDCDDTTSSVHPGAAETCDGVDEDCDGAVDEDAVDPSTWYLDGDGDGVGRDGRPAVACDAPPAHVGVGGDCDDADPAVLPGATEVCNGLDDDCDGLTDEGVLGTDPACPATSCAEILAGNPSAVDGPYLLSTGGGDLDVWCDMSGGGWTLGFVKNSMDWGTTGDFGHGYVNTAHLAIDPAAASASTSAINGWLDLNAFAFTALRVASYHSGAVTFVSQDIGASDLRIAFGDNGYLLYGSPYGYYWCAGDAAYTDSGSGQVSRPSGAPADCKGHGSLGSGWDFSEANTPNQGLTLCGGDASYWMHAEWQGTTYSFGNVGAAQAVWVR